MLSGLGKRVYLACGHTDMRKSINGLMAIVEGSFRLDPFGEALFVFCNRSRDRLKFCSGTGTASGCTSSGWRRAISHVIAQKFVMVIPPLPAGAGVETAGHPPI